MFYLFLEDDKHKFVVFEEEFFVQLTMQKSLLKQLIKLTAQAEQVKLLTLPDCNHQFYNHGEPI